MNHDFAAFFTYKGLWRSCDVTELGVYPTQEAAITAGQEHATQRTDHATGESHRLAWQGVPDGLVAKTTFGRYDIRKINRGR